MVLRWVGTILLSLSLLGCGGSGDDDDNGGGGSGLPRSTQMGDLSSDELRQYCTWQADYMGGGGTEYDCGDDRTYTVATVDECAATANEECYDTCDLTVGQLEDCTEAMMPDPCVGGNDAGCMAAIECAFSCMGA